MNSIVRVAINIATTEVMNIYRHRTAQGERSPARMVTNLALQSLHALIWKSEPAQMNFFTHRNIHQDRPIPQSSERSPNDR